MPKPLRVLYCEDNPVDAELVSIVLARAQGRFTFEHVESIGAAKTRLAPPGDADFDVVLTDMNLPDGDGIELIAALRSQGMSGALVALTGAGDDRKVVAALKAGADDYVFKKGDYLMRLPALLERATERTRRPVAARRPLRVLYVESNPVDAQLVADYLARHAPYLQFETAGSGESALQRIEPARTPVPDLVVVDQDLPRMSAFDLVKELREVRGLDLPAVLVTRHGDEDVALQAMRLGFGDYLVKSAGFLAQLPAVIEHVHARAELDRERRLLAQAQARFYDVVNATGEYVWETDAALRFTYVSGRVRAVLGYGEDELIGRSLAELMPEGEHRRILDWIQANADAQGSFRELEHRVIGRDGQALWQRLHAAAVRDEDGRLVGYRGTAMDVTERRRTEELRVAREARLVRQSDALARLSRSQVAARSGLDAALGEIVAVAAEALEVEWAGVWLLDEARANLRCREGYERRSGRRRVHPPLRREHHPAYFAALEQERTLTARDEGDGSEPVDRTGTRPVTALLDAPVRLRGTTVGVVCHEHDGAVRDWQEDERRFAASIADLVAVAIESEQVRSARRVRDRLAAILEATSDLVAIADPDGTLRFLNRAGRALIGVAEDADLRGMDFAMLHPPAAFEQLQRAAIPAAIERGTWSGDTELRARDGRVIPGSQVLIALRDASGGIEHVATIIRDLSQVRLAEEALRESEQRRLRALEAGTMMDWVWDLPSDRLLWGRDPAWMLGPLPEGATAYPDFRTMVHPDDREAFLEAGQRSIREGAAYRVEFRVVRTDGGIRWLLGQGQPVRGALGEVVALTGINLDITESRLKEALLREKDERLRIAMHAGRMIEWEWDVGPDVLYWGDDPSPVLGPPCAQGPRRYPDFRELVLPEDREAFLASGRRCLDEGGDYHAEFRIRTTDGHTRWLVTRGRGVRDARGAVTRMVGVAVDLTDLRVAEQAVRESEARLKAFFDHSPALISVCDVQGRHLMVNRRYSETLGIEPASMSGRTVQDFFPPKYAEVYADHIRRVVASGRAISLQDKVLYPDGERSFFTTRFPIFGAQGQLVATGAIASDITALKRAEQELARLNTELEQRVNDRTSELRAALRELESFSHTVAHDLRAPARAMGGFARVLTTDFAATLDPAAVHMLERISRNAAHMQQLIDDLLEFSRTSRAQLERAPTDLTAIARGCLDHLQPDLVQRRIDIRIHPLGEARVDASLFGQVFANLVGNAVKFTRKRDDAVIEVGRKHVNGETFYYVRDNGAGFDMRHAGQLFRVFQRLHRADEFEGTGIGLANVARIVERHGGRVWAEGEPDHGATFCFTIGG